MDIKIGETYDGKTVLDIVTAPISVDDRRAFWTNQLPGGRCGFVGQAAAPIAAGQEIVLYASDRGWFGIPKKDFLSSPIPLWATQNPTALECPAHT
jgi:hypothetical protein